MLYLGIDQHAMQLTICLRNESGNIVMRRQVSTHPVKVTAFFEEVFQLTESCELVVMLEVCGFNDWLIARLREYRCREIILVQPQSASRKKTDRRDAAKLSELLWINHKRLLAGERIQGVRQVLIPDPDDAHNRQLTSLRQRLGRQKTQTINRIKHILNKHNLIHGKPTKMFQTLAVRRWLRELKLRVIDRLEMDQLLSGWELIECQLQDVAVEIQKRSAVDSNAQILGTMTGKAGYTALAIASRIGPIERFKSARSLANFFGLTPTCHSSGQSKQLGHISKEGSPIVRFLLGQLVLHMLRRDAGLKAWYTKLKKRRGTKIARVGVMRKLACSIWFMIRHQRPYEPLGYRMQSQPEEKQHAMSV